MKKMKKLILCLSAFVLCMGFALLNGATAQAALKDIPKKVHTYTGECWFTYINFDSKGSRITNLKSSSSNLKVKLTSQNTDSATISYFAKKDGTYKITFTVKPKTGKSVKKTITVVADQVYPIKKATYAGKTIPLYTYRSVFSNSCISTASSGKLSITMSKGYKLTAIVLGTWKKATDASPIEKRVKNNSKITLGKTHIYKEGDSFSSDLYSKWASVTVYYTSPYSSEEEHEIFFINML